MSTLQTLASLPPHIIKSIIGFVIEAPDDFEDLVAEYVTENMFKPLPHICQSWRAVAMPMMFSGCDAVLGATVTFGYQAVGTNPCVVDHVESCYNKYVRSIALKLEYASIVDGTAMRQLQDGGYAATCFTNARDADINVVLASKNDGTGGSNGAAVENVRLITTFIQRALPGINNVHIKIDDRMSEGTDIHSGALGLLLNGLSHESSTVELKMQQSSRASVVHSCMASHGLTLLECRWDSAHKQTARLIHANVHTLQHLRVCFHTTAGFRRLIFTEADKLVVYPYLVRLAISKASDARIGLLPAIDHVAPFPRLQHLQVTLEYPFSDDLPFRGNSSTLSFLSVGLNPRMIRLLRNSRTLGKGHARALDHLVVGNFCGERSERMDDLYRDFFAWVMRDIRYLFIHDPVDTQLMLQSLPANLEYRNLQLLSMVYSSISFTQIVRILQVCSHLKVLICRYSNMGDDFCDMSIQQVAATLRARFDPLNQHIQTLYIFDFEPNSINMMAASIMLLADQCPHLRIIKFPKQREDRALSVLLRLSQSRYPVELRESFLSKVEFVLNHISIYTIIQIKRKLVACATGGRR